MKIAVASKDFTKVTGHAGQARHWLIFQVEAGAEPVEVQRLELARELTFHHYKGGEPHPLEKVDALIAASAGEGFLRRLRKRGVDAVLTGEKDPRAAVADYMTGKLRPPRPRPVMSLFCKLRDRFSEHRD